MKITSLALGRVERAEAWDGHAAAGVQLDSDDALAWVSVKDAGDDFSRFSLGQAGLLSQLLGHFCFGHSRFSLGEPCEGISIAVFTQLRGIRWKSRYSNTEIDPWKSLKSIIWST